MRIGKIFNIPIILHWSLLIGLGYFAFDVLRSGSPFLPADLAGGQRVVMALFISSSLFASILVHELAHSLMAKRLGYVVLDITLMLFGGVSMISGDTRRAAHEFAVAIVGPASSLALAVLAFAALRFGPFDDNALVRGWLIYMTIVNGFVAVFNMLPGLPLDGGRVARSAIWTITGDRVRASRYAALGGQGLALLLGVGAIGLMVWQQDFTAGIWILLIAGFLWLGATREMRATRPDDEDLIGVPIHEAMTPIPAVLSADMPLGEVLSYGLRVFRHLDLPVVGNGAVIGFVTLADIENRRVDFGSQAPPLTVGDVFRRCRTGVVRSDADLSVAANLLARGVERLVVFNDGRLVGTIGRDDIVRHTSAGNQDGL